MFFFRFGVFLSAVAFASAECKCTPKDECWPSPAEFAALNDTVSGNLILSTPPGSVCHTNQPNFSPEKCNFVLQNWFSSSFHTNDPVSVGFPKWAGNPCPPIYPNGTSVTGSPNAGRTLCDLGGYPVYVLNATRVEDIQAVVKFASEKNIRLNVKSTGHSVEGRSTAANSISIWTHHFLSREFHESFRPKSCPTEYPDHLAVSLSAGARVREVYEFAHQHNAVVVGGSAEDVGIIGWLTGGGHGPLTSRYGQGSDNVLQVTLVTPNGKVLIANEYQNTDLFWAIRGGGGGTFGVITHVTMRAYQAPSTIAHRLEVTAENERDDGTAFWNTIEGIYALLPELKRRGFSGNIFMDRPPLVPKRSFSWNFNLLRDKLSGNDTHEAERLLAPLHLYLDSQSATVSYKSSLKFYADWFDSWDHAVRTEPGVVASSGIAMASRSIPETALVNTSSFPMSTFNSVLGLFSEANRPKSLASTLQSISESVTGFQAHLAIHQPSELSPFLATPPTAAELNRTSLPAHWRSAPLQFFTVTTYPDNATIEGERAVFESVTNGVGQVLKDFAPTAGSYLNEGDAFDPDWQVSYFGGGENYEALRRIKRRVDPEGVLWCVGCVGSDEWFANDGRLCRA